MPTDTPGPTVESLTAENQRLVSEVAGLEGVVGDLQALAAERDKVIGQLQASNVQLRGRVEELERLVEKAVRASKRQAAPFAKELNPKPRKPGRKPGQGKHGHRAVPARVDRVVDVPLPQRCPHCEHDTLREDRVADQYQSDIPPITPVVTKFRVHVGHCEKCRRRVQGHHDEQVSDALGAAGVVLGPRAVALLVWFNKTFGLSHGKCVKLLHLFGIDVTPSGATQAIGRAGRRSESTYEQLKTAIRGSPVVTPDETGWRIGGGSVWLWVFATPALSVYLIDRGRGFDQATKILPAGYTGTIVRDGWAPYRRYTKASHQTCVAHLLRRCRELSDAAPAAARAIPAELALILHDALDVRDEHNNGGFTATKYAQEIVGLDERLNALLDRRPVNDANRRLLKHVANERDAILTFLRQPGIDATNWRAEQAVRPAVVNRKVWGGNRTRNGANAQQTLMSVLHTAEKQHHDPINIMTAILLGQTVPLT